MSEKKITPNFMMDPKGKKKSFNEIMIKLLGYCREYVFVILIAWIAAAIGTILQVFGPDKLKDLTNEIMKGLPSIINGKQVVLSINMSAILKITWILVALYGLSLVLNYSQTLIMATVTQFISKKMREDISRKINRLPLKYFDATSYGDVLSRVTNDVDAIGETLNQSVGALITSITTITGTVLFMFLNSWILAITTIVSSALGLVFMKLIMKASQKFFMEQQMEIGHINGHIEEIYAGHNVVKVYNGSKEAIETFEEINSKLYNSAWKSQFLAGLMSTIMNFMGNFGYAAVCLIGAVLAMEGQITFGVIVAFMMYVKLFSSPLSQIALHMVNLQRTAAASERVFTFLEEAELENEADKKMKLTNIKGDVEFKNVKFGYSKDKMVINDFSANIKAGQKVAIVGPTGAGKTTIVNLLMKFYDLNGGEIFIDGVPIQMVPRENVHSQFSMVLQDTWLFEGTIRENIIYSKKGVTEEEVIKVCKTVGIHHFIKALPKGYDTVIGDKASFSEGQKQLITIARAMIQNAPLLILDEATSSVDTRMERIVQDAMDKLTVGRTSFVIAHRLSTIKNADVILVMKDGDIIESGNHKELLSKDGFYAELYNNQFEAG